MIFKPLFLLATMSLVACSSNVKNIQITDEKDPVINRWKILEDREFKKDENLNMYIFSKNSDKEEKIHKILKEFDFKYQITDTSKIFENERFNVQIEFDRFGNFSDVMSEYNAYPSLTKLSSKISLEKFKNKCAMIEGDDIKIIICNKALY